MEPARDHDCHCGAQARLWVDIGLANPEPCCRACAARVASDDAFVEALATAHRQPTDDALPPFEPTRFHKAGAAVAHKVATDPEFRQVYVEGGRRRAAVKRRCAQCPMVTSPPNLALHQRASGHTGWEAVS